MDLDIGSNDERNYKIRGELTSRIGPEEQGINQFSWIVRIEIDPYDFNVSELKRMNYVACAACASVYV